MSNTGKITSVNNDLKYGFVKVPTVGDVFFSLKTQFQGTNFEALKVDDSVKLSIIETDRGLFAESLGLSVAIQKEPNRPPEASL